MVIRAQAKAEQRQTMNREKVLKQLDAAWTALKASYAGLPEEALLEAGVAGEWSVRDILVHITTWEEEAIAHLPAIAAGGRAPRYSVTYGGLDAFNALRMEQKRTLALADVLRQLDETHQWLLDYVQSAPDELFASGTRWRRRLYLDTYHHYPLHTEAILAWRGRAERGEIPAG